MLTAAPIVRKPQSVIGAPGRTDFVKIYIASELNKPEYRTILRHEQAHVWAGHNRRVPKGKDARIDLWIIACEMEIARTIYDEKDIENINAPRSRLSEGYLPDSFKDMPGDILLAEDIYEWLLKQPAVETYAVSCGCSFDENLEGSEENSQKEPVADISTVRELLDEKESGELSKVAQSENYKRLRDRPPSLTDEIDSALRVRIERERSHRRPSRRGEEKNVIIAGRVSTPRPPLIEIFVDRSGSFSPEKTRQAEERLRKLLSRYGASVKSDVWFFGGGKLTSDDPGGGGDTPYHLVSQHLSKSLPKIAVVITDDDPVGESVTPILGSVIVCVPIGCSSTRLAKALGGKDVI